MSLQTIAHLKDGPTLQDILGDVLSLFASESAH